MDPQSGQANPAGISSAGDNGIRLGTILWWVGGGTVGVVAGLASFVVVNYTFVPIVVACAVSGAIAVDLVLADMSNALTRQRLFIELGTLQFILMTGFLYRTDILLRLTDTPGIGVIHLVGLLLAALSSWVAAGSYPKATTEGRLIELAGRGVAMLAAIVGTVITTFWGLFWGTGS